MSEIQLKQALEAANTAVAEYWASSFPVKGEREFRIARALLSLHERLEAAEKALEWYGSAEAHQNKYGGWGPNDDTPVNIDRGAKARAAIDLARGKR